MNRILIVEDRAVNRALLLAVLKPDGSEVLTAADGWLGVEVAQRERALNAGGDGYIAKPIATRLVARQVRLFWQ